MTPRFLDIRSTEITEQTSLDLARHLPQRLAVGRVVIIAERPALLLPALRKRWMHIIREVERQRASTLIREKRQALEYELARLRGYRFTAHVVASGRADVLIVTLDEALQMRLDCATLYVLAAAAPAQLLRLAGNTLSGGLLVLYGKAAANPPVAV